MSLLAFLSGQKNKNFKIGGGSYQVTIASDYVTAYTHDGTFLFAPKGAESITVRITVVSFDSKDGQKNAAVTAVIEEAKSLGLQYEIENNDFVILKKKPYSTKEGSTELVMQFWTIGNRNNYIIISTTTLLEMNTSKKVERVLEDIPNIISTIVER